MSRLGITGHQSIPESAQGFVRQRLAAEVAREAGSALWGITSLAAGADQLFARTVLRAEGKLLVVVPSDHYESTFRSADLRSYRRLLRAASETERLSYEQPTEEAFFAAGRRVADLCDRLLAVWDGRPAQGLGGTADVVRYARSIGRRVVVIWPAGVLRQPAAG